MRGLASVVFDQLDDFERLGAHMLEPSWMMGGSRMRFEFDALGGRALHAKVRLRGSVLGLHLLIDEAATEHTRPTAKTWETIGIPRMFVISAYRMGYVVKPEGAGCRLRVFIDYTLPPRRFARWLGRIAGQSYARWCVTSMIADAARSFGRADHSSSDIVSHGSAL